MGLDLKTVDIAGQEDWQALEEDWNFYFDNDLSFSHYHKLLSNLNVIVGFGRGFWPGIKHYFYLVFHTENQKFYWYLKDIQSDTDVYFYEVDGNSKIFNLLTSKSIEDNFDLFDAELDFNTLYSLSVGDAKELPLKMKAVTLTEVFGEDTNQLRIALMYFNPGSEGAKYPHKEFHNKFFLPECKQKLNEKIQLYNKGSFHVFLNGNKLYIKINEDTFELKEIENKV